MPSTVAPGSVPVPLLVPRVGIEWREQFSIPFRRRLTGLWIKSFRESNFRPSWPKSGEKRGLLPTWRRTVPRLSWFMIDAETVAFSRGFEKTIASSTTKVRLRISGCGLSTIQSCSIATGGPIPLSCQFWLTALKTVPPRGGHSIQPATRCGPLHHPSGRSISS